MFNSFLSALLYEILSFLAKHGKENLANLKVPAVFRKYLEEVSDAEFLRDLQLVLEVINGADMATLSLKTSPFFSALLEFFSDTFASKLDQMDMNFYLLPYEDRLKKAQELLNSESKTAHALRDLLVNNSYQELAEAFENLSKTVKDASTILIQIPRAIPRELKKEMREQLASEHPYSFPVFQINKQLIGGFRVFVDGKSIDHSWFSKVQKLSSLTH